MTAVYMLLFVERTALPHSVRKLLYLLVRSSTLTFQHSGHVNVRKMWFSALLFLSYWFHFLVWLDSITSHLSNLLNCLVGLNCRSRCCVECLRLHCSDAAKSAQWQIAHLYKHALFTQDRGELWWRIAYAPFWISLDFFKRLQGSGKIS